MSSPTPKSPSPQPLELGFADHHLEQNVVQGKRQQRTTEVWGIGDGEMYGLYSWAHTQAEDIHNKQI